MVGQVVVSARRQGQAERDRWQMRVFIFIIIFMGLCTYVQLFEERSLFSVNDQILLKSFMSSIVQNITTSSFANKLSWSSLSSSFDTKSSSSSSQDDEEASPSRLYAPVLHHEYYSIIKPQAKSRAVRAPLSMIAVAKKKLGFQDVASGSFDLSRLRSAAKAFLLERNEAYRQADKLQTFQLRGIGYLYLVHNMILVAKVPDHPQLFKNKTIRIYNVYDGPILDGSDEENKKRHNNKNNNANRKDCHLFTIWVRVMGPELFAGTAQAIQPDDPSSTESCYWEFSFYLQVPGDYQVHAKSLLYDGYADRHMEPPPVGTGMQCSVIHNADLRHDNETYKQITIQYPLHAGFQGFKMYDPPGSCCEVCSRMPDCQYWATPAFDIPSPSFPTNGCELFFSQDAADKNVVPESKRIAGMIAELQEQKRIKLEEQQKQKEEEKQKQAQGKPQQRRRRRLKQRNHTILFQQQRRRRLQVDAYHGARHNYPTAYFVGCSWSFWFSLDFGCLSGELDDQVLMLNNNFTTLQHPMQNSNNSMALPVDTTTTGEEKKGALATMNRKVDPSLPLCELSNMKFSQDGGRWVRQDWPNSTMCPFPVEYENTHSPITTHRGDYPRCWHRNNLNILKTQCTEMNCRFIDEKSYWRGPLQQEKEWFGVWRYNNCNLLEFKDRQIQKCIDHHKISSFVERGSSIAKKIGYHIHHRLGNITLANTTTTKDTVQVCYDTVSAPHLAWRSDEKTIRATLETMEPMSNFHYVVLPFYWTSERETYVHAMNAEKISLLMEQILAPKGFRIINAFDFTKVFPYDTATQSDGLHIIGPPLKMFTTILFHDLCKDVVEGGTFV